MNTSFIPAVLLDEDDDDVEEEDDDDDDEERDDDDEAFRFAIFCFVLRRARNRSRSSTLSFDIIVLDFCGEHDNDGVCR
jgi:hypothetical protein